MPIGHFTVSGIPELKHNFSASTAPTITDDKNKEYSVGSLWVNLTTAMAYLCVDNTIGVAIWRLIGANFPSPTPGLTATNFTALNTTYPAASYTGHFSWVIASQGIRLINYKPSGWYYSDGSTWEPADLVEDQADYIGADTTGFTYSANDTVQEVLTDLDTALVGKAATSHTHTLANITDYHPNNIVSNLRITSTTSGVTVTADYIGLETIVLSNVNKTALITSSGAGGLDTGAEAANTWYYIWIISNADGSTNHVLLSTSSTSPTMPGGYTRKRRIGSVRNNSSSDFVLFIQTGSHILYDDAATNIALNNGLATTFTDVSCATFVPPTSQQCTIDHQLIINHNAANVLFTSVVRQKGSTAASGNVGNGLVSQVANVSILGYSNGQCGLDSSQVLQYKISGTPTGSSGVTLRVAGYVERI